MATFALFVWPLIAIALFNALGRMKGVIWAVVLPALTLPEKVVYDLPGLPPYNKDMAIVAGLLLGLLVTQSRKDNTAAPAVADPFAKKAIFGLAGLLLVSGFLTVVTNREPLVYGPVTLPGLGIRDLISMTSASLLLLATYLIAQRHLSTPEAHTELLKVFVIAGLIYTLPILFEARMSPQLHRWTYGFFQHSWQQHIRGGYFRPIVFMPHGLWIGILLTCCAMAAFVLLKNKVKSGGPRIQFFLAGLWLLGVLLLSRNLGAAALAAVFVPVLWFLRFKVQIWIAIAIMAWFVIHPALRQTELVTFENASNYVGRISVERQESFDYRIENEAAFLERAALKPVAGWGIWARWRIRDPITGEDISTSDGRWISVLGERGWIGFIAYFGLLTLPTFMLLRAARRWEMTQATAGLGLIMAAVIAYQIPNNTIGPLVLVVAGALSGFIMYGAGESNAASQDLDETEPPRQSRYTRFPDGTQSRNREPQRDRNRLRPVKSNLRRSFSS